MSRPSIDAIRTRLRTFSAAEHQVIARRAGVPFSTLRKIAYGITPNPRLSTFVKLEKWYRGAE